MKTIPLILLLMVLGCATKKSENGAFSNNLPTGCFTDVGDPKESEVAFTVTKCIFENGLTLLVSENHRLPILSFYTFFDVGARHEKPGLTGGSHLLEHMLFKGSKNYGPGVFDGEIEKNGGNTNAYTSNDQTVYQDNIPSFFLEKIIEMNADRFIDLSLENESFQKERAVVLEERKFRYENSPHGKIYLHTMQEMFKGTPYEESVIGREPDLKTMTHEQINRYYRQNYSPEKTTIVIAGDINTEETIKLIKKNFGRWQRQEKSFDLPTEAYRPTLLENKELKLKGTAERPLIMMAIKGAANGTRLHYVYDFLTSIFSAGKSSPLYEKYVLAKNPLLTKVDLFIHSLKHSGVIMLSGELASGVEVGVVKEKLHKDLRLLCDRAINERSIEKVRNQQMLSLFESLKTNNSLAHYLGSYDTFEGDFRKYKEIVKIYKSISIKELKTSCVTLFDKNPVLFTSLWKNY